MSTIVTRAGKGSALTHTEVDNNFTNLNTDKIEADQSVTLTNKTIALGSNTVSGTTAQFNTALTDGDFATLAGSETLTNKTISGSSNTLSNIGNSSLTNSSVTIGSTSVSLGSTATTVSGLTLSSPTVSGGTINDASVGATTPSTGAFTTLSASSTVSGTGFSTYLASPPAIGGTAAAAGSFTTLSATGVATFQAGSNSAPAITTSGDTNTGVFFPAADTVAIGTGGTERLRVDSAGNVGIGTSSPVSKLEVYDSAGTSVNIISDTATTLGAQRFSSDTGQPIILSRKARGTFASPSAVATNDVSGQWLTQAYAGTNWRNVGSIDVLVSNYTSDTNISGVIRFSTNNASTGVAERMRITAAGEVYIAGTTDQGAYNLQCNGTGVWGAGAYVNGSDERIKEDIAPLTSGLDVVAKLNPVTYRFKESWSKDQSIQPGFIAQELLVAMEGQDYIDGVVQQGGSENYYSVAYQNIIPLLTKAIQELKAIVDAQAVEIAALKGQA